jgi:predicted transcriptional regulator YdeE
MNYSIVTQKPLLVMGKELRLNLADQNAPHKIEMLWQNLYAKNLLADVSFPERPVNIIGLYTDYDSASNYSLIVGCTVQSLDNMPEGLVGRQIPEAKYAVFTVQGNTPQVLQEFWKELWDKKDTIGFTRAFSFDFELYGQRYFSDKPELDVYISII